MCIRVCGSNRKFGNIGDVIVASVRVQHQAELLKGDVIKAMIVRSVKGLRRADGTTLV